MLLSYLSIFFLNSILDSKFPVGRIFRFLKKGRLAGRITAAASVYLAAVLEYLTAEVLELAGIVARKNKRIRIVPRHIKLAIRNDAEMISLLGIATIFLSGVKPFIHSSVAMEQSIDQT